MHQFQSNYQYSIQQLSQIKQIQLFIINYHSSANLNYFILYHRLYANFYQDIHLYTSSIHILHHIIKLYQSIFYLSFHKPIFKYKLYLFIIQYPNIIYHIFKSIISIMSKTFITILGLIALFALFSKIHINNPSQDLYSQWKNQYGFNFQNEEDQYRRIIFMNTLQEVTQFNKFKQNTYEKGINQFSHLTDKQFQQSYLSTKQTRSKQIIVDNQLPTNLGIDIDWVLLGKVSAVKNQGTCDAGYAFSTTGLLQSYTRIKSNNNTEFSQQQIVDCAGAYATSGCQGGSRAGSLNYVQEKGISFESQYPYRGVAGTCKADSGSFKFNNYGTVTGCDAIGTALRTSPLTIAADATNWRSYKTGIFSNCTVNVTHDVLLVGQTTNYWKIKNSWGLTWGQYGYIRLALGNTCGICGINAYWITD